MFNFKYFFALLLFIVQLICTAQDTIYTYRGVITDIKIRDEQPDFVEYRVAYDEFSKKNYFLTKKDIIAIVRPRGFHQIIEHSSAGSFKSSYCFVRSNGDTDRVNLNYNPARGYDHDSTIQLCHLKNDKEYLKIYGPQPHFYINDPDKQFANCKTLTYVGIDFSCMKLVNQKEISKAALIYNTHLKELAEIVNHPTLFGYTRSGFIASKSLIEDMAASENSYQALDSISWISEADYLLPAGKIPSIIRSKKYKHTSGTGIVFILENLSKTNASCSGYWVAFDFATRKTLLIDYVYFGGVRPQASAPGWAGFWEAALMGLGTSEPLSFQNYLAQQQKGAFELICN